MNLTNVLDSPSENPTLVVDSRRCRYSSELTKELQRTDLSNVIKIVDIGALSTEDLKGLVWLLGTPTLLEGESVYLGVDAFVRSRELARETLLRM